jgi:hypothetical protein
MRFIFLIVGFVFPLSLFPQSSSKVLLHELDSIYIGKCKNGLADGLGEAWGAFHYKGKFVQGYPQGEGRAEYPDGTSFEGNWKKGLKNGKGAIYIFENGKVVKKLGWWENNIMKKEIVPPAYKVITQQNFNRIRVFRQGNENYVWFYPNSTGGISTDFADIRLSGNTGTEIFMKPKLGFENVQFPFTGTIRYSSWNKMRTMQYEVYCEIEIYQPGNWVVEIQN